MNALARWSAPIALALLVAGCSDPAANVTEATVGDALPVPTVTATSYEADATDDADAPAAATLADLLKAAPAGEAVAFDGSNSRIDFVGSKLVGGSHDGGFKDFDGQFVLSPEGVAFVAATIDMNSTWTDNDKLTDHLKNQDFFEVGTYPESAFVSTAIAAAPDGAEGATHEVTGNLTLHGTTRPVTFPATVSVTDASVALDAEFKIDRTLWNIAYGAESDVRDRIINKDVVIRLDLDAPRVASAAGASDASE